METHEATLEGALDAAEKAGRERDGLRLALEQIAAALGFVDRLSAPISGSPFDNGALIERAKEARTALATNASLHAQIASLHERIDKVRAGSDKHKAKAADYKAAFELHYGATERLRRMLNAGKGDSLDVVLAIAERRISGVARRPDLQRDAELSGWQSFEQIAARVGDLEERLDNVDKWSEGVTPARDVAKLEAAQSETDKVLRAIAQNLDVFEAANHRICERIDALEGRTGALETIDGNRRESIQAAERLISGAEP